MIHYLLNFFRSFRILNSNVFNIFKMLFHFFKFLSFLFDHGAIYVKHFFQYWSEYCNEILLITWTRRPLAFTLTLGIHSIGIFNIQCNCVIHKMFIYKIPKLQMPRNFIETCNIQSITHERIKYVTMMVETMRNFIILWYKRKTWHMKNETSYAKQDKIRLILENQIKQNNTFNSCRNSHGYTR